MKIFGFYSIFYQSILYKNNGVYHLFSIFYHSIDKKGQKWGFGEKLKSININEMPEYIFKNVKKYKYWLDFENN